MRQVEGRWTSPEVVPFSGRFSDADPFVSPDGRRLYFVSRRPADPAGTAEKDWDIWFVERDGSRWGEPRNLGAPVNTPRPEMYVSVTRDGTVYYHSNREDSAGEMDIYRSRLVDGRHQEPENLGPMVNSAFNEWDPFVAPDESYVIFTSSGRPDDLGRGDMYISFRTKDGAWSPAKNMGRPVNSAAFDYCPTLSPDGKYLFFSSYRLSSLLPRASAGRASACSRSSPGR